MPRLELFPAVPPPATATVEAPSGALYLRAAPCPDAPRLGRVPDGARLPLLTRQGGWYAVRYKGRAGYVSGDDIVLNY